VVRLGSEDWVPVRKRFCLGFYFWLGPWLDGVSMRPLDEMYFGSKVEARDEIERGS